MLQPVQRGVERALLNLERTARDLSEAESVMALSPISVRGRMAAFS
jgi:hypothetical protein